MFVGFPIISAILQVLAAINSAARTNKRRERQNYYVVGSEHGEYGYYQIQKDKKLHLPRLRPLQYRACKIAEKAQLVKVNRKYGHRNEQHKNFKWVDRCVGNQRLPDAFRIRKPRNKQDYRAGQRNYPICIDRNFAEFQLRKKQYAYYHYRDSGYK